MNLCGQSVGFRIFWIFFNGLLMEVGGFPQFTAISAGHTLQATFIAVETLSRLTLRRASQELSRVSCTLPVLHCTDDSQQTVEKGHSRPNWAMRAMSGLPPLATELRTSRHVRDVPEADSCTAT
jgi:hypothetical protein